METIMVLYMDSHGEMEKCPKHTNKRILVMVLLEKALETLVFVWCFYCLFQQDDEW